MSFTIGVESVDGCVHAKIVAESSEKICGGMKAVDWVRIKSNWQHLQDIPFPKLVNRGKIDVLLGTDNYHLMYIMFATMAKQRQKTTIELSLFRTRSFTFVKMLICSNKHLHAV